MARFLVPIIVFVILFVGYTLVKDQISQPQQISTPQAQESQITQENSKKTKIKIFLIALEDKGKSGKLIGCDDSVVPQEQESTQSTLKAAIEDLLNLDQKYYGQSGLYNALYKSGLKLESADFKVDLATIKLTGDYQFTGVCEDARFISQIEETALQFPEVKKVEIYLNNQNLNNLYKGS